MKILFLKVGLYVMEKMVHLIYVIDSLLVLVRVLSIFFLHASCTNYPICFTSGAGAVNKQHSTGGSSSTTPEIFVQGSVLSEAQMPSHTHGGVTGIEDNENIYYDGKAVPEYFISTIQKYKDKTTRWFHVRDNGWENCTTCQHTHTINSSGGNQPHSHVATSSEISLIPRFYALVYIMKL